MKQPEAFVEQFMAQFISSAMMNHKEARVKLILIERIYYLFNLLYVGADQRS